MGVALVQIGGVSGGALLCAAPKGSILTKKNWFTIVFSRRCLLGFSLTAYFDENPFPERDKKAPQGGKCRATLLQWLDAGSLGM